MKKENLTTQQIINQIKDSTAEGSPYDENGLTRYCIHIDDENAKETVENALKNAGLKKEHLLQLKKDGALVGYFMDERALHIQLSNHFLLRMKSQSPKAIPKGQAHTKGEWKINYVNSDVIEITPKNDWKVLAQLTTFDRQNRLHSSQSFEQIDANAQRIVKAVNSFDVMREALKEVLAFEKRGADKGEPRIGNGILSIVRNALKQAEQK